MTDTYKYEHYKSIPEPAEKVNAKKKKPKLMAVRYGSMNASAARYVPMFAPNSPGMPFACCLPKNLKLFMNIQ